MFFSKIKTVICEALLESCVQLIRATLTEPKLLIRDGQCILHGFIKVAFKHFEKIYATLFHITLTQPL